LHQQILLVRARISRPSYVVSASENVDVNLPAGVDSAAISAVLTVVEGVSCIASTSATAVSVAKPLAAVITQKLMDGGTFTVTLTGNA
jgi:hypothetical protein